MNKKNCNSFETLEIQEDRYQYHSLPRLFQKVGQAPDRFPYSLKVLLENLLRNEDGVLVKQKDIENLLAWVPEQPSESEIQFTPSRVILQDFTGVPVVADLGAMRSAMQRLGGDPTRINPLQPVDLVIDHSVQVDSFGSSDSFQENSRLEFERNTERYQFLKWGQKAFKNFRVVPPAMGIVHQINLEFLAQIVMTSPAQEGRQWLYPETLVGTDSHTTMINGLGVLGWGVGGIEAEAALLGQPCSMLIPPVLGVSLVGQLPAGVTSTDLVLTVTQRLRKRGVVGYFVEFYGPGLKFLSLADRATISNMAPEYGATIGIFPVDAVTMNYLKLTNRASRIPLVQSYYEKQGLWYVPGVTPLPQYSDTLEIDLSQIEPSLAGPSRPQDRVALQQVPASFQSFMGKTTVIDPQAGLQHGSVVIAAITSCTNTSNPSVLIAAGLLARNAVKKGLKVKPWVKTSLAPGSQVVVNYLQASGLLKELEALNFHLVGYGCTTCIGNSGPLSSEISEKIDQQALTTVAVLSGNRNFEGRVHQRVRANYLASPPLVVAYAIAGHVLIQFDREPLGHDPEGQPVFLKDIWPHAAEIQQYIERYVTAEQFQKSYASVFEGSQDWQALEQVESQIYSWNTQSTYIQEPPFLKEVEASPPVLEDICGARVLVFLGDSITTDHISPAGTIRAQSPAGSYLMSLGVSPEEFNSYGARRGNHEVMVRGTFANTRLKNLLLSHVEGGMTYYLPEKDASSQPISIYEASQNYQKNKIPLIVLAGKEYGTGSSRDWAAKGSQLLGIRAILAESFERIHRSNLIGMGILPLQFLSGQNAQALGLTGLESFDILHLEALTPKKIIEITYQRDSLRASFKAMVRIDTLNELEYFKQGGILPYVLRQILKNS